MPAHRPFRFGVMLPASASHKDIVNWARKAETLGYSTLLVGDHPAAGAPGPIATLAAAADATTTLRLGSYVFANDFRHPALLAQEVATLDRLSGGRVEFGIGTGWQRADYAALGIPLEPPGVRVSRLIEAVSLIKRLFQDEPTSFSGRYYQVQALDLQPKPLQRPHPPLVIGGGARRTLSLAGREADIVSVNIKTTAEGELDLSSTTAQAAAQKVQWVREAAGERFDALELNILIPLVVVADKRRRAAEQLQRQWGIPQALFSVDQMLQSPSVLVGSADQIVEDLRERRERYGFCYITVFGSNIDTLRPVVARLAGT